MIKKVFKYIYFRSKGVKLDFKSSIPFRSVKINVNKEYPVVINNSIIGNCSIQEGCRLSNCYCLGNINLGRFVSIFGPGTVLSAIIGKISIGSFSSIGQNVAIQESYHNFHNKTSYLIFKNFYKEIGVHDFISKGNIIIEEDVWIGSNSVVLSGVKIGRGSVIAAGSIVTKNTERYSIYAGNPAKLVKMRFTNEQIEKIENSRWWTWDIEKLKIEKGFFTS